MATSAKLDDDLKSRIRMSAEDSVIFFDAIDNPPRANDRLKAACDRARKQKIIPKLLE